MEAQRREAMRLFLDVHARMARLERRMRRTETAIVVLLAVAIVTNATLPALGGFQPLDLLNYALACWLALSMRGWVLGAITRRRQWRLCELAADETRRRLAHE